jgi:hypothetical protein
MVETVYDNTVLHWAEEIGLLDLIEQSIIRRYDGDLERREDPRCKRADTYTPLDTDTIRTLLTTLWGGRVSAETIEEVFDRLTTDGAEQWPKAWCEEDLEIERNQRLARIEYEIECVEQRIKNKRKHSKS